MQERIEKIELSIITKTHCAFQCFEQKAKANHVNMIFLYWNQTLRSQQISLLLSINYYIKPFILNIRWLKNPVTSSVSNNINQNYDHFQTLV